MVKPSERRKKKKFRRTPGGKTNRVSLKKRPSAKKCQLCGSKLSGTLSGRKEVKASLSQKRPSAPFAGRLCNVCRAVVMEEALKVKLGVKKEEEVEPRLRGAVSEALKKIEG